MQQRLSRFFLQRSSTKLKPNQDKQKKKTISRVSEVNKSNCLPELTIAALRRGHDLVSVAETRRIQLPKNSNRESHKLISCSNSGATETRFGSDIGDQVRNEGKLKIEKKNKKQKTKKQRIRNIRTEEVGDCKQSCLGESKRKFFLSGIETKAYEKKWNYEGSRN
ncbi:hypothetical protein V8G54_029273 [Vigna mungo]|uniref:Uncharacterized protein n=1 Tax=Vigna mungo TaxID=3915 RepID=A0AAQ3RLA9_VIGMU